MISDETLVKLVTIYKTNKYGPVIFEELASMRSPKPAIDLERRRASINIRHKMKMARSEIVDFFTLLQPLKLGKIEAFEEWGKGNSKFHWTHDSNVVDVAKSVIERATTKKQPEPVATTGDTVYVYRTRHGEVLKFNNTDIDDLRDFIEALGST